MRRYNNAQGWGSVTRSRGLVPPGRYPLARVIPSDVEGSRLPTITPRGVIHAPVSSWVVRQERVVGCGWWCAPGDGTPQPGEEPRRAPCSPHCPAPTQDACQRLVLRGGSHPGGDPRLLSARVLGRRPARTSGCGGCYSLQRRHCRQHQRQCHAADPTARCLCPSSPMCPRRHHRS
jgi:hypothetical protein